MFVCNEHIELSQHAHYIKAIKILFAFIVCECCVVGDGGSGGGILEMAACVFAPRSLSKSFTFSCVTPCVFEYMYKQKAQYKNIKKISLSIYIYSYRVESGVTSQQTTHVA